MKMSVFFLQNYSYICILISHSLPESFPHNVKAGKAEKMKRKRGTEK